MVHFKQKQPCLPKKPQKNRKNKNNPPQISAGMATSQRADTVTCLSHVSCMFVALMVKAAAGCGGEPVWEGKENAVPAVEIP